MSKKKLIVIKMPRRSGDGYYKKRMWKYTVADVFGVECPVPVLRGLKWGSFNQVDDDVC